MPDDAEVPDENDDAKEDVDTSDEERAPKRWAVPPGLNGFSDIQRQLAAIDFSALRAAQRAIQQSAAFRLPEVWAAQDLVAKHFAKSIDFSHLTGAYKAINDAAAMSGAVAAQKLWADSLAKSIRIPALEHAIASSAALAAFSNNNSALLDSIKAVQDQAGIFARIRQGFDFKLPTIDISKWLEALDRWIPVNLRTVDSLDEVAAIALDEGVPLSWIPRTEIVTDLVSAGSADDRDAILDKRRDDILDDCEAALTPFTNEWAVQSRAAISAMRLDLDGPAQSHASNIIDSVVLALHGKKGRDTAKSRAQEDFDDQPLQLAAENLTLRPLFRAFTTWHPNTGVTPPEYFARHPTAHAVGHAGVFAARSALVAVMLATSLTVQYSPSEERDEEGGLNPT